MNIVVYGQFENTIGIDQYRSVLTDFTLQSPELMKTFELIKSVKDFHATRMGHWSFCHK